MMKLFQLTALVAFVIAFATPAKAWTWPPNSNDDCFWMNSNVDACYYQCAAAGGNLDQFSLRAKNAVCPGVAPAWWTKGNSCLSMKKSLEVYCRYRETWAGSFWALNLLINRKFFYQWRVGGGKNYSAPKVR